MQAHRVFISPENGQPGFSALVTELPPLEIWGPTDPRPTPPIVIPPEPPPVLPPTEPHSDWKYDGEAGGWFFVSGPYPRPRPIACVARTAADDPIKGKWTLQADGWYFVAGPYDRPFPICDTEPPDEVEPPDDPPGAHWKYDNGWYLCYGPMDKPGPITPPAK